MLDEEYCYFTEFLICSLADAERHGQVRPKLFLYLFDMKLDAPRADHIVSSPDDAELIVCAVSSYFSDIVGDQHLLADMRRTDDELPNVALTVGETELDTTERRVPL